MKNVNPFDQLKSFTYAGRGIYDMLKSQPNAWIHLLATIIVCLLGIVYGFSSSEWCCIILAIVAVWTAEAFNTALEFLADAVSPQFHPLIRHAKDVAAAAVLITAIGAVIIGIMIIGPYIFRN